MSGLERRVIAGPVAGSGIDYLQSDDSRVNKLFTLVLEIDRYTVIYDGLDLTDTPVRLVGVADEDAGGEVIGHSSERSLWTSLEIELDMDCAT